MQSSAMAAGVGEVEVPRYYFDTDDGERRVQDQFGVDLGSEAEVAEATRDLLFDIGHAEILDGQDRVFTAAARDVRGVVVLRGSMVLRIESCPPAS